MATSAQPMLAAAGGFAGVGSTSSSSPSHASRVAGAATEAVLAARGDADRLKRVLDGSAVPMLIVDGGRRYVEVNRPARLAFRLTLAEMRRYRIDDLTPPDALPTMETAWARLIGTGCVAGPYEVAEPDGGTFDVVYCGVADILPGLHLLAFVIAGWPADELVVVDPTGAVPRLTPREREVLELAAEGFSGPQIAEQLVLSPRTVKRHFDNLYARLGVGDRAAAVARGLRHGLIY
jgi:DNA-binding CsgD family transcriptional regulator